MQDVHNTENTGGSLEHQNKIKLKYYRENKNNHIDYYKQYNNQIDITLLNNSDGR